MPLIIGIDVTHTLSGGSLTQVEHIVQNLGCFGKKNRLIIYTKSSNLSLFGKARISNAQIYVSHFCGFGVVARVFWEQIALPVLLKMHKVDVLFCPGNIAPFISPSKTIQWIGTIGPFWEEFYKLNVPIITKIKCRVNKVLMWRTARNSDCVVFESEYCRKLFVSDYGIKQEKTEVIRIGKDNFFYPEIVEAENFVVNGINIHKPFILCVSHLYEYKNYERLIEAFAKALKKLPKGTKLVIAGSIINRFYYQNILETIRKHGCESDVVYMGLVKKGNLRLLYSNCRVFVFPSPVETIGYILVEAMLCGAPIVTSKTTSMPETCGDAALYFDPNEVNQIKNAMLEVSNDEVIRSNLRRKSLSRVEQFPDYTEVNQKTSNIIKELSVNKV